MKYLKRYEDINKKNSRFNLGDVKFRNAVEGYFIYRGNFSESENFILVDIYYDFSDVLNVKFEIDIDEHGVEVERLTLRREDEKDFFKFIENPDFYKEKEKFNL